MMSENSGKRLMRSYLLFFLVIAGAAGAGIFSGPYIHQLKERWFSEPAVSTGDYSAILSEAGAKVVLFSTTTCPYCKMTRQLLTEKGISFRDYVLDDNPQAVDLFESIDGEKVPVLLIGSTRVSGFQKQEILKALSAL